PITGYIAERPEAALSTALSTLFAGGGQAAVMKGVSVLANRGQAKADQAIAAAETLDQLGRFAAASKVIQRDPETFEKFIADATEDGPVSQVFIDGQTLMQSGVAQAVAEISPSVAAQLPDALQTGGQIAIPVEEYATRIAPTEFAGSLIDHLRTDPDGFSRAEAKTWMIDAAPRFAEEISRAVAARATDEALQTGQQTVKEAILTELDGLKQFSPQVNEAYATVLSSYYAVRGKQLGMTPESLYQQRKINFAAEGLTGEALNQALASRPPKGWEHVTRPDAGVGLWNKTSPAEAVFWTDLSGKLATDSPDIANYSHSFTRSIAAHIRKQHGEEKREKSRGQLAVTEADIARVPEIVTKYDAVLPDVRTKDERGRDVRLVIYAKQYADATVVYSEIVSDQRQNLRGGTMWKYPSGVDATTALRRASPNLTSETGGGHVPTLPESGDELNQPAFHGSSNIAGMNPQGADKGDSNPAGTPEAQSANDRETATKLVQSATPERAARTLAEAREQAKAFVGKTLENRATGRRGTVSGNNLAKMTSDSAMRKSTSPESHMLAVANADKLFENAALDHSHADKKGTSTIAEIHRFVAPMLMPDGEVLAVKLTVKETTGPNEPNPIYSIEALDVEKPVREAPTNAGIERVMGGDAVATHPTDGLSSNVVTLVKKVKRAARIVRESAPAAESPSASPRRDAGDNDDIRYQGGDAPRGAFNPASLTVSLLKGADLSTTLHEGAHFFFENDLALAYEIVKSVRAGETVSEGEKQILRDVSTLLEKHGIEGDVETQLLRWGAMDFDERRSYHEATAEWFEQYLFEGKAPSLELASYFQKFAAWMKRIYRSITDFLTAHPEAGRIDDEVRGVFDRMLATEEQIQLAEQGRSLMPLFEDVQRSGMDPETFAAYQSLDPEATATAIAELQAKSLRDMKWLAKARGKALRRLQREVKTLRAEAMIEARKKVMSQPVYQAWQFLTGKLKPEDKIETPVRANDPDVVDETRDSLFIAIAKLGGIDKDEAISTWGIDPKDYPRSGVFGKPVWRVKDGLSLYGMGEALSQFGYLALDEDGRFDLRELEDKFSEELRGNTQYSNAYTPEPEMRPGDELANPRALGAGRLDLTALEMIFGGAQDERLTPPYEAEQILTGPAVASTKTTDAPSGSYSAVIDWAAGLFEKAGGKAKHPLLGEITLDRRAVKASMAHGGANRYKRAAFAVLPKVIERGAVVRLAQRGRDGMSYYISAPVTIDEMENIVTVLVNRDPNGQRMYLHSVTQKESLLNRGVSGADTRSVERTGSNDAGDTANILHSLLTGKGRSPLVEALRARRMTARTGGLHPDIAADLIVDEDGAPLFSSGDEMIRALAAAIPPNEAIEALSGQILLERHGELATPEALEQAADAAIHNEVRARFVAMEANALAKATGKPGILLAAAKEYAAQAIGRLRVRDIKPGQYARAEVRAARAADKAFKADDIPVAAAEKRNQVIQQQLTRAAYRALEEAAAIERRFVRMAKAREKNLAKTRDLDVVMVARAILAEYGIGGWKDRRRATEYVDKLKTYNQALVETFQETIRAATERAEQIRAGNPKGPVLSYLSLDELKSLADTVGSLWEVASRNKIAEIDGKRERLDEIGRKLTMRLRELGAKPPPAGDVPGHNRAITDNEKRLSRWQSLKAGLRRVEHWVDAMDKGDINGLFRRYIFTPVSEAADRYRAQTAETLKAFRALVASIESTLKPMKIAAPEIKYTFGYSTGNQGKGELLHALLHTGNASNKRKLLLGRGWAVEREDGTLDTSRWDGFIDRMIAEGKITQADMDFCQGVWDLLESTKPGAQRAHHAVFGAYFEEITSEPVVTPWGTYRGGYVPAITDPGVVERRDLQQEMEALNESGSYMFPTTNKGFTKSR
ncbi:MAG: hypothetical protein LBI62_02530, partial [Candidatus Accumulibacter sp.]|nr:hypothetical protein [Accumulibacter sp.]